MLILKCKLVKFLILATTQAMSRHYWSLLATFILTYSQNFAALFSYVSGLPKTVEAR